MSGDAYVMCDIGRCRVEDCAHCREEGTTAHSARYVDGQACWYDARCPVCRRSLREGDPIVLDLCDEAWFCKTCEQAVTA